MGNYVRVFEFCTHDQDVMEEQLNQDIIDNEADGASLIDVKISTSYGEDMKDVKKVIILIFKDKNGKNTRRRY